MNVEAMWKVARAALEMVSQYGTPLYQREVAITILCEKPMIVIFDKQDGKSLRFMTQFELDIEGHATELERTALRNALQIRGCLCSPPPGIGWPFNHPGYQEAPLTPRESGRLMAENSVTGTVTTKMAEASAMPAREPPMNNDKFNVLKLSGTPCGQGPLSGKGKGKGKGSPPLNSTPLAAPPSPSGGPGLGKGKGKGLTSPETPSRALAASPRAALGGGLPRPPAPAPVWRPTIALPGKGKR